MNIKTLEDLVCNTYKITPDQIRKKTRKTEIVFPRQVLMYLCITWLNISFQKTADHFSKDHSTVVHAKKKVLDCYDTEYETRINIDDMEKKIISNFIIPDCVVTDIDLLQLTENYTNSLIKA